jgi:hypothetical protein
MQYLRTPERRDVLVDPNQQQMETLVDRKLQLFAVNEKVERMSTEDFFTRDDRKELYRQTLLNEQMLRDLADIKAGAKEVAMNHREGMEAHEQRIRALESYRLQLQTQLKTSWWWILLLSAIGSGVVNLAVKLLGK